MGPKSHTTTYGPTQGANQQHPYTAASHSYIWSAPRWDKHKAVSPMAMGLLTSLAIIILSPADREPAWLYCNFSSSYSRTSVMRGHFRFPVTLQFKRSPKPIGFRIKRQVRISSFLSTLSARRSDEE
ncbi:hypothetical protein AVEN_76220-1 [Araneus ventricosus]|uniref:Uncharacterized protein n=1 Tax=Araneus ventricosus TaxID=182803 RepID=A0A4Y2KV31_ARAVE|nr:hypothetical protein AVEN_76220-1 [Araneus ventricosus]